MPGSNYKKTLIQVPAATPVFIYGILDIAQRFLYVGKTIHPIARKNPALRAKRRDFKWRGYEFRNCEFRVLRMSSEASSRRIDGQIIANRKRRKQCVFNTNMGGAYAMPST